jgi:small subunit ribosomal protein S5
MGNREQTNRPPRGGRGGGRGAGSGGEQGGAPGDNSRGGQRDNRPRSDRRERDRRDDEREELDERVIDIKRVAKVIKGGRRFAFRTVVVVGDGKGRIGIGIGKARAVPDSIRKGTDRARRNLKPVPLSGTTIPHPVIGEYGGAKVMLRPAAPGTGVIAGGGVRAVLEAVGVHDILTKSQGSNNLLNVAMATLTALQQLRSPEQLAAMRGKPINHVRPLWERTRREETQETPNNG